MWSSDASKNRPHTHSKILSGPLAEEISRFTVRAWKWIRKRRLPTMTRRCISNRRRQENDPTEKSPRHYNNHPPSFHLPHDKHPTPKSRWNRSSAHIQRIESHWTTVFRHADECRQSLLSSFVRSRRHSLQAEWVVRRVSHLLSARASCWSHRWRSPCSHRRHSPWSVREEQEWSDDEHLARGSRDEHCRQRKDAGMWCVESGHECHLVDVWHPKQRRAEMVVRWTRKCDQRWERTDRVDRRWHWWFAIRRSVDRPTTRDWKIYNERRGRERERVVRVMNVRSVVTGWDRWECRWAEVDHLLVCRWWSVACFRDIFWESGDVSPIR